MRVSNVVGLGLFLVAGSVASADIYLSGVVFYAANANGSSASEPAEFDNIVGTNNSEGSVNGALRGTTFLLQNGDNDFAYGGVWNGFNALSMYFSATSDPFARPFGSTPDLVVYGSDVPLTPVAGAMVQTNGQFSGLAAYSGNSTFTLGDQTVTVTQVTASSNGGTFRLTVRQVPAPAGLGMLAGLGLVATRRRR